MTDEQPETPPQPSEPASSERALPVSTVIALKNCVTAGVSRLSRHSYELSFEVQLTKEGIVEEVDLNGNGLDDVVLEECMLDALEVLAAPD